MKGDFSRNTFKSGNHFSRVLMQQGRVQLDADKNEQTSILLHYLRTLTADLIGPHGGVSGAFKITSEDEDKDLAIAAGHYYVNGILCENEESVRYSQQDEADYPSPKPLSTGYHLVYLDVWERHITHIETDKSLREVALGGPDTSSRAKVIWQVKLVDLQDIEIDNEDEAGINCSDIKNKWDDIVQAWQPKNRGMLQARAKITADMNLDEPCIISPDSRYRGPENQLYRIEIHLGSADEAGPTFKWSRENGSVIFPITSIAGQKITLANLGRDGRFTLKEGDWIEYVDDAVVLHGQANPLYKVNEIDRSEMTVTLAPDKTLTPKDGWQDRHPILRRWDHQTTPQDSEENGLPVSSGWIKLEDGVQIQFAPPLDAGAPPLEVTYRTGDYWLIPARTATGDVEWPQENDQPNALPPHGVEHHYAPLALIQVDGSKVTGDVKDCRLVFKSIVEEPTS